MKNDRRHFTRPREPLARSETGSERIAQLTCHSEQWHGLPMRSCLKRTYVISTAGRNPGLDFLSHWCGIRNDKTEFLINAVKKRPASTVCRGLPASCLAGRRQPLGKPPTGFSEPDVGEPPDVKCDVVIVQDGLMSAELKTTWLADKETRHGCVVEGSNKNSSQVSMQRRTISWSSIIAIQMARSKLSESNRSECIHLNKLWLEVGVSYSNILEYDSPSAINSAGPDSSRRIGNWHQYVLPISLPVGYLAEWNSFMVEPVRLVLRRWRGVCSFSQTMRGTRSDEESHLVYDLRSKKRSRPARRISGGEMICSDHTQRH